jgi:protein farnesyltransferase subunit beta
VSNIAALVKYIMSCCQYQDGGLRDKPPMRSDFYHSLYSLAGLSAAQYHYVFDKTLKGEDSEESLKWTVKGTFEGIEGDQVEKVHPIFVLPWGDAERIRTWFYKKGPTKA